ncbi:MAG: hypothetical protein ACYDE0_09070 [Acidiferrobacterales bacterium]
MPSCCIRAGPGVRDFRNLGERHPKLILRHADGAILDAIAFNQASDAWQPGRRVRAAYRPDVNLFQGSRSLQLIVSQLWPHDPT